MFVVVLYAIHDREIINKYVFENRDDANIFMNKEAQRHYESEMKTLGKDNVDINVCKERAIVTSHCGGSYIWVYEIIEIKPNVEIDVSGTV